MIKSYQFTAPTKVVFGWGEVANLRSHLPTSTRVIIVTGKGSSQKFGQLDAVKEALGDLPYVVYQGVSPNPRIEEVTLAAKLGKDYAVDLVIGLGGGSALDAAKAVAVEIGSGLTASELLKSGQAAPESTLPIVAIPTTAGTGSEASQGAILSDHGRGVKTGIRGPAILPSLALIDPQLTVSMPKKITAETGFDILTHAIESWASKKSSEMTKVFSREAIEKVFQWLPVALLDLNSQEARTELSFASMLMGYNLANSSTCLPHRLQYPIGAKTDTSHPVGLAAIYPAWSEATEPFAPECFEFVKKCAEKHGYPHDGGAGDVARGFLEKWELSCGLKDFGITEEDLSLLVDSVEGSLANDPGLLDKESLISIYQKSL